VSVLVFVEDADELAQQALTFARAYDAEVDAIAFGDAPAITGVRTLHVAETDGYAPQAWRARSPSSRRRRWSRRGPIAATRCSPMPR